MEPKKLGFAIVFALIGGLVHFYGLSILPRALVTPAMGFLTFMCLSFLLKRSWTAFLMTYVLWVVIRWWSPVPPLQWVQRGDKQYIVLPMRGNQ